MAGMTIKQMNRAQFWKALEAYKAALRKGESAAMVETSLKLHYALGGEGVPKSFKRFVTRAYHNNGVEVL